ncbi:hypothetical protein [Yinghuangia soli]|uniref:TIGR04222 domain-containing membrane protein n=1 Tax=Yinghuangia soli TaxID=2908204 RepID=A0AA41PYY3_9ACTN|nr:hypothetical protein [Yinghuangia soli]MCF2528348.1 hypothetical protein [Yinghuangia soli]
MPLLDALRQRRSDARARQQAQFARDLAYRPVSLYQAAQFTGGSPTEVAVWLLLEGGHVHVARDGRARAASGASPANLPDPVQHLVLALLMRHPGGLKLHEMIADPECALHCEYARPVDVWEIFPDAKRRAATAFLDAHCRLMLARRFAGLGFPEERAALRMYRHRAPVYQAPGSADSYRVPSRRRRSGSSSSSSDGGGCGTSCGGSCGGGGCGGCGGG